MKPVETVSDFENNSINAFDLMRPVYEQVMSILILIVTALGQCYGGSITELYQKFHSSDGNLYKVSLTSGNTKADNMFFKLKTNFCFRTPCTRTNTKGWTNRYDLQYYYGDSSRYSDIPREINPNMSSITINHADEEVIVGTLDGLFVTRHMSVETRDTAFFIYVVAMEKLMIFNLSSTWKEDVELFKANYRRGLSRSFLVFLFDNNLRLTNLLDVDFQSNQALLRMYQMVGNHLMTHLKPVDLGIRNVASRSPVDIAKSIQIGEANIRAQKELEWREGQSICGNAIVGRVSSDCNR